MLPKELIIHIFNYMDIRVNMLRVFPWLKEINILCDFCKNKTAVFLIRYISNPEAIITKKEMAICNSQCEKFNYNDFKCFHFDELYDHTTVMVHPQEEDILIKTRIKSIFVADHILQDVIRNFIDGKEDEYINSIIREFYRKLPKRKRLQLRIKF